MAASPIESFIRSREDASMKASFDAFLQEPRIRDWVNGDEARVERLRDEFTRVWANVKESGDAGQVTVNPVRRKPETSTRRMRLSPLPPGRHVMCPNCRSMDLGAHVTGDVAGVQCRRCGRVYNDLLELVPVRPVGPFAFVFGEGWRGVANAVGLAAVLVLLYWGLRAWL